MLRKKKKKNVEKKKTKGNGEKKEQRYKERGEVSVGIQTLKYM